ncbi:hypothetical protein ACNKHU_00050 [Shigella flexneri]
MIDDAVAWAKQQSDDRAQQIVNATDKLAVIIGLEILNSFRPSQLKLMHVLPIT